MTEHIWKEDFITTGKWETYTTCLQGWKCKTCKTVTHTPLGVNPSDFEQIACIAPPPAVKQPWKCPIKTKEVNKRDYPAKKQTRP